MSADSLAQEVENLKKQLDQERSLSQKLQSQQSELKRQLQHAQKMDSIGLLASGIAHDFNNSLTVISGYADMLAMHLETDPLALPLLDEIQNAVQQASGLTRNLLIFSRKAPSEQRVMNLVTEVGRAIGFIKRLLPASISLHCELPPEPIMLLADPTQIQQIILNLVVNAKDALSKTGGEIRILLSKRPLAGPASAESEPAMITELKIIDNGPGIAEANLNQVFEPFFTTKPVGKGTGLGLSIVKTLVQELGGRLTVESTPGKETCFSISFELSPLAEWPQEPQPNKPLIEARGERILVAEDDPSLLPVLKLMLNKWGFRVLSTEDGTEILPLFSQNYPDIQLLILDADMPGMSGLSCIESLRAQGFQVPIILISGYPEMLDQALPDPLVGLLHKPFSRADLAELMEHLLNPQAPAPSQTD